MEDRGQKAHDPGPRGHAHRRDIVPDAAHEITHLLALEEGEGAGQEEGIEFLTLFPLDGPGEPDEDVAHE